MNQQFCDQEVYEHGESLGFFDMTKDDANNTCMRMTRDTGLKHDWHYVAGRVHIKYLPRHHNYEWVLYREEETEDGPALFEESRAAYTEAGKAELDAVARSILPVRSSIMRADKKLT